MAAQYISADALTDIPITSTIHPYNICRDFTGIAKMPEMEKLTINLSPVDVGQIELLVEQGFYPNRAEFIRVAIHDQLAKHADVVRETTSRQAMVIGAVFYDRRGLEQVRRSGERLSVRVVGLLVIREDVPPDLARDTIESLSVHGVFKANKDVKKALADRMRG
jgi:Arc/MetJ-type ribon-helix-helix transcriptional regulator